MLTFKNLRDRVLRMIDEATATASSTTALVNDALNASHRRICAARRWPWLRWPTEGSFTTTAATRAYALHRQVGKLLYVWDVNGKSYVPLVPLRQWEESTNRDNVEQTYPGANLGPHWPVALQPSATGSVIDIASTSASDVVAGSNTPSVFLQGIDDEGEMVEETIIATGATPVSSANLYTFLTKVVKIGTWVGTCSVEDAGSNVLVTLAPAEAARQYPTLEFTAPPPAGRVYRYAFLRQPKTLSLDNDIPDIPFPQSEILVYDTLLDLSAYNTELGAKEQALWSARAKELLKNLEDACDDAIVGAQPRTVRDLDSDVITGQRFWR